MKKTTNIFWGIVLILLGLIIGLNAFGITDINIFFEGWWTLFIIVPCIIGLFNDTNKTGSIIGILIGVALLLLVRDVISIDLVLKLAVPVILVIIGLSLIFKDVFNAKTKEKIKEINKTQSGKEYVATFSGQDINFNEEEFTGAELSAIFGGVKLDLRKAIIKEDSVINVCAIFGGVDILVADNVNVKVNSTSIFGGVSDKRKNKDKKEANTIYINATCVFGGTDIK